MATTLDEIRSIQADTQAKLKELHDKGQSQTDELNAVIQSIQGQTAHNNYHEKKQPPPQKKTPWAITLGSGLLGLVLGGGLGWVIWGSG